MLSSSIHKLFKTLFRHLFNYISWITITLLLPKLRIINIQTIVVSLKKNTQKRNTKTTFLWISSSDSVARHWSKSRPNRIKSPIPFHHVFVRVISFDECRHPGIGEFRAAWAYAPIRDTKKEKKREMEWRSFDVRRHWEW